jgi:hypothetical protein
MIASRWAPITLVCFAHIAAGNTFTTAELYPYVLAALQMSADQYSLASLRYDLRKLRAKDLVQKLSKSRRYRLCPQGYSICLVFLKLFERVYSPLTAGLLQPYRPDSKLQNQMISMSFSMLLASKLPEQREHSSRKR